MTIHSSTGNILLHLILVIHNLVISYHVAYHLSPCSLSLITVLGCKVLLYTPEYTKLSVLQYAAFVVVDCHQ